MIWLHTGGLYCETWDEQLRESLNRRSLSFKESTFSQVERGHMLIGRVNEFSNISKEQYRETHQRFARCWPEPKVYDLYDDKLAQLKLFTEYKIPHPKTVYFTGGGCDIDFPAVQKYRSGSASKNVSLVNRNEAQVGTLIQEFCEGNDRDFRLVVIDDKAMGFERLNKPGSFKASGSGLIRPVDVLPPECVAIGRHVTKIVGAASMCFDFVKLRGEWVVLEMSYTYQYEAVNKHCHFYLQGDSRVDCRPDPADMIVGNLVGKGLL